MSRPSTDGSDRVVIIGAGIGGLMLGAILNKLGRPYILIERSTALTPVGAGLSLAPNALRALEQLGLGQAIRANSQELHKIRIHRVYDGKPQEWKSLDFSLAETWFGYNVRSIERHSFHRLLFEAANGAETVQMSCDVVDVIDDPKEPTVVVKLRDGREFHGGLVVGADGIRSVTRRILARNAGNKEANSIQFTGRVHMSGYSAPLPHLSPEDKHTGNWLLYDDSLLVTWPCIEDRQWFIGVKQAEKGIDPDPDRSVWRGATKDTVNEVYGDHFHPFGENEKVRDIVNRAERVIASNVFAEVSFASMSAGRVALLGDAAHSMTSMFGQGACQAIEDAVELANAISAISSPAETSKQLEKYSEARMQRGRDVSDFSANYARVHTGQYPVPGWRGGFVRYLLYHWCPSSVWMWYLRWLYGYQPTVKGLQ